MTEDWICSLTPPWPSICKVILLHTSVALWDHRFTTGTGSLQDHHVICSMAWYFCTLNSCMCYFTYWLNIFWFAYPFSSQMCSFITSDFCFSNYYNLMHIVTRVLNIKLTLMFTVFAQLEQFQYMRFIESHTT